MTNIDRCLPPCTPQNPKVTADRAFNGFGTNFDNSPEPIYGTQVRTGVVVLPSRVCVCVCACWQTYVCG